VSQPKNKGITVPKPKTVSMRKYSELKAKYDKLVDEYNEMALENGNLKGHVAKQSEELRLLSNSAGTESKTMHAALGLAPNREIQVLDTVVNALVGLNQYQRRFVIGGLLSINLERSRQELANLTQSTMNSESELAYRVNNLKALQDDMAMTAAAVEKYTVSS